jgi:hypothetical protein
MRTQPKKRVRACVQQQWAVNALVVGSRVWEMESVRDEQYAALKFCVRLQKSATEAL